MLVRALLAVARVLYRPFPLFDAAIIALLQAFYNAVWDGSAVLVGSFSLVLILVPLGFKCAITIAHLLSVFKIEDLITLFFFATVYPMIVLQVFFNRNNVWKQQKRRNCQQKAKKFDQINKQSLRAQTEVPFRFVCCVIDGLMFFIARDTGLYALALLLAYYVDCLMVRERNPDRFKLPAVFGPKIATAFR